MRVRFVVVFCLFCLVAAGVSARAARPMLSKGAVAPDFTAQTPDGGTLRLSDYRGRVVVLEFWADWCRPSMESLPALEDIVRRYGQNGVSVVAVAMDDSRANFDHWVRANRTPTFTIAFDPAGNRSPSEIGSGYGIGYFPTQFVIDENGIVRASGNMSEDEIDDVLASINRHPAGGAGQPSAATESIHVIPQSLNISGYMTDKPIDPYAGMTENAGIARARALVAKGRFDDAATLVKSMALRGQTRQLGPIYNALGDRAASTGRADDAWGWYLLAERSSTAPAVLAHAHFGLATYFTGLGKPDQAKAELQAIVDLPGVDSADKAKAQSMLTGDSSPR